MNLKTLLESEEFKNPSPEQLERQRLAFETKSPEDIAFNKRLVILRQIACIEGLMEGDVKNLTFEKYEKRIGLLPSFNAAVSWTPADTKGLFFYGTVGTGKSHLLTAVALKWASKDRQACFCRLSDLLAAFKANFDEMEDLKAKYKTTPLLFVDDIGTESGTPFAEDQIFQILDYRVRFGGHTFGSSNLTPDEIESKYHPRILDRLYQLCRFIELKGKSYRRLKAEEDNAAIAQR